MRSTHLSGMVRRETLILKDGTYKIILFQRHFWAVYDYAGKQRISQFLKGYIEIQKEKRFFFSQKQISTQQEHFGKILQYRSSPVFPDRFVAF